MSFGYRDDYDRRAVVERLRRFRRFSFLSCGTRLRRYSTGRRRPSSPSGDQRVSTGRGNRLASRQDTWFWTRSSVRRCLPPCVLRFRRKAAVRLGTECRLRLSRARLIFFRGPPAPCGSTAFPRSITFVIQSPCGRSLQRLLLERRARNGSVLLGLRSFRLHREKATGSVTELRSRECRS